MKKLLLLIVAALGGFLAYRQITGSRADKDLWTEATDSVTAAADLR